MDAFIIYLYKRKRNHQRCKQSPWDIATVNSRTIISQNPSQLPHETLQRRPFTWEPVRLPKRTWNHIHDIFCMAVTRQIPRAKCGSLLNLCWSNKGVWHCVRKVYGGYWQSMVAHLTIVWLLHDIIMARVPDDGNTSEPFLVSNGVKQGCVLAQTLFSQMFSAMLTDACCTC